MKKLLLILLLASCQHYEQPRASHEWFTESFTATVTGKELKQDQTNIESYYRGVYDSFIATSGADKQELTFIWVSYNNTYTLTAWLNGATASMGERHHTVDPPKLPKPPPPSMR